MLRRDFLSVSTFAIGVGIQGPGSAAQLPFAKSILDYGAKPDGKTLSTRAIQRAIDDISAAGGGTVYAPPGNFLTGGLELKSGVMLYLEAGSVLLGSTSNEDYAYHPGPPNSGDANGHHLLFASKSENVTICGPGAIDGQGQAYWEPKAANRLRPASEFWKDVYSQDYEAKYNNLRPSPMIELAECRNVRVSGVTLRNSAGWTLRSVASETVVIDAVRIRNPNFGVNTDGIDIMCSQNVMISNCDIETGDDAICLKSDNPYGETLPTRNITVTNCLLTTPCNGFKIGTGTKGSFENIAFSNSIIYGEASSPINTRPIGGISIEMVDGGSIDGVVISNIRMQNVRAPIFIRLGNRQKRANSSLRNVSIDNVDATGATFTSTITGIPGLRPSDIAISNCRIRTVEQGQAGWVGREIPEVVEGYPESIMMGRLPAHAFFIRHADRVRLRNVECITDRPDGRPAIVCDDVKDLILADLELAAPAGDAAVIELKGTQRAFLTGMRIPTAAKAYMTISGSDSSDISFAGNSFKPDQHNVTFTDGATERAIGADNSD
jgi:hypothetical protein